MKYQKLFEKGYIGGVEIRNRVAMTAMGNGLATWDGEASPELIRFYEAVSYTHLDVYKRQPGRHGGQLRFAAAFCHLL